MSNLNDRQNAKLMALLRLSREGVGNEQSTAARLLKKHLAAAGLTIADFENGLGTVKTHIFKYDKKVAFDEKLLIQIICQVTNSNRISSYRNTNNGHTVAQLGIECTPAKAAEITLRQELYRHSLAEELELGFEAFVQQNSIYRDLSDSDDRDDSIDLDRLEKIMQKMSTITPTLVNKQIESSS